MSGWFIPGVLAGSVLWASLTAVVASLLLGRGCGVRSAGIFCILLPLRLLLPVPAPWGAFPGSDRRLADRGAGFLSRFVSADHGELPGRDPE